MQRWKRVLIVGMCTLILSFTVMSTYQQASEVKAIIGVDDALILIGLLASFGIVAGTYVVGNNAEKLYDELEEGYDATRFTLLEGGGGNPDDPENDDDNINDENGDGKVDAKDIPTFRSLVSQYGLAGAIKYTPSILACLAPTIYSYYKSKTADLTVSSGLTSVLKKCPEFNTNTYPYFVQVPQYSSSYRCAENYFITSPACIIKKKTIDGNYSYTIRSTRNIIRRFFNSSGTWNGPYIFENGNFNFSSPSNPTFVNNPNDISFGYHLYTNLPIVDSEEEVSEILNRNEVIWTTPELQDTYKNEGDFKRLPMRDPNKAYDIPSQQALENLDNDMLNNNLTDEERNQLINDFINNLKNPNTDPAPGTNPDSPTNPDPDNPTNPDPDNPTNPDPDNPTNPDPDNPTTPDTELGNFALEGLSKLFPFCIPFDLIDFIGVLAAEPEPPKFTFPFFVSNKDGIVRKDIVIDFTDYSSLASIARKLETFAFIVMLIVITRQKMIRG